MSGFCSVDKKFSGRRYSKGNQCADLELRRELAIDVLGEDPGRFGVAWTARVSSRILTQLCALRTFARNTSETTTLPAPRSLITTTERPRPGPHGPGSPRASRSLLHRGPHPGVSVCMPARETRAPQRPPAKRVVPDSDDFGALGARVMNLSRHRAGSRAAPFRCAHVGRTRVANWKLPSFHTTHQTQ